MFWARGLPVFRALPNLDRVSGEVGCGEVRKVMNAKTPTPIAPSAHLAAHRAAHRSGKPSKLDDPEVRAFVDARIENMTFEELALACLDRFDDGRAPGRSALHRYWKKIQPAVPSTELRVGRAYRAASGRLTLESLVKRLAQGRIREGAVIPIDLSAGRMQFAAALVIVRISASTEAESLEHPKGGGNLAP